MSRDEIVSAESFRPDQLANKIERLHDLNFDLYKEMVANRDRIEKIAELLKCQPEEIEKKVDALIAREKELNERP